MAKQNLVTGKGETFDLNITFKDSNNVPVDLTGHEADLVVSKVSNAEVIGTYPATVDNAGNIAISVADEVTALWPVGKTAYRVEHHTPAGDVKWLVFGNLTIMDGTN